MKTLAALKDCEVNKERFFYVCNRYLNNHIVKCELCETSLHKTCAKITQHQYMLIHRKHIVYHCHSCCEIFPFQNISDDECIFENSSVEKKVDSHALVDKYSHFNVNLFKYSDDKTFGFESDIDPDNNFCNKTLH